MMKGRVVMKWNLLPAVLGMVLCLWFPRQILAKGEMQGDSRYDKAWSDSLCNGLESLLQDCLLQTSQLGLCVYDLTADSMVFAYNSRQRMRPASIQKVVTAVTGLSVLYEDYHFNTRLCYTGQVRDSVLWGDIYAVGGFDPLFGEKDMQVFVGAVEALGIDSIAGHLIADVSMKDTLQWGYGWCWDDDMPLLTPLLYEQEDVFMEVVADRLSDVGIHVTGITKGFLPAGTMLLAQCSRPLGEVLVPMMKESDNLCAEALFYQLAAHDGVPFASRKEAVCHIKKLISEIGCDAEVCLIADGSGVSLYNYLTPEIEIALLRYAYQKDGIFYPLYASLPIAGEDGTLQNRMQHGKARGNVRAKTGTLTGVITLAGYATACNGHRLAFCMMNQGVQKAAAARAFQDRVCELLCR